MSVYDEVPYESRPIPISHVDRVALAARLRGMTPADPARSRVLELGCAEGANVIAMAFHLDEAEFVGVDASERQIEAGRVARDRLGLDNLDLRVGDFATMGDELGTFDYVIVHGVLSWIAPPLRTRLWEIVGASLRPEGVAYVSYNCAAGWGPKDELRRMLLEHTAPLATHAEKIARTRAILSMLAGSPLKESSLHAAALAEKARAALGHRDAYLFHEYLAEHNHAYRHRELLALVEAHGLAFLTELAAASGVPGLEDRLRSGLQTQLGDDPLQIEEMVDLMIGRAFRASLFVHRDALPPDPSRRERGYEVAAEAHFRGKIEPEAKRLSLDREVAESFTTPSGLKISARSHVLKAALLELGKWWPRGLTVDQLVERANLLLELRRVLKPGEAVSAEERAALGRDLYELCHLGHVEMALREPDVEVEVPERPRVSALTRHEAEHLEVVSNPRHDLVPLDPYERRLVAHLDGSRTVPELADAMRAHLDAGDVVLHDEDGTRLEGDALAATAPALLDDALAKLARTCLLTRS